MSKVTLNDVTSGYNLNKINENFATIAAALNNDVLWRDNPPGEANELITSLDANSQSIYNLADPVLDTEPVTLGYLTENVGDTTSLLQASIDAVAAAASAEADAISAAASAAAAAASATGDVYSNTTSSVDSEIALFSGTAGKTIKRATTTGLLKAASGVLAAAVAGTDYSGGTSALSTGLVKSTTATGALSIAVAGTDYLTPTGDGSGLTGVAAGFTLATPQSASGTSLTFSGLPSTTKCLIVVFENLGQSSTDNFLVRLGDSGGIETTGYLSSSADGGSGVSSTTGFIVKSGSSTNNTSGCMIIALQNSTTRTWVGFGAYRQEDSNLGLTSGGQKSLSDTITQLSVVTSAGSTLNVGAINVLYQ